MCFNLTLQRITCEDRRKVTVYDDLIVKLSLKNISKDEKDAIIFQKA